MIESGQRGLTPVTTASCSLYQEQVESGARPSDLVMPPYPSNTSVSYRPPMPNHPQFHSDHREFVCGWGAAFINITVTFPINKVMFRQMLHGISTQRALRQLKKEGLGKLYRGILPPLCHKTVSTSIMFGMYEKYRQIMKAHYPSLTTSGTMALAAVLAGCTEAILCPLERIQTLLQDRRFHAMYKNTLHCAQELRQFGLREYYRGLYLILIRNSISNILFFGFRTQIKDVVPRFGDAWYEHIVVDFISGAVLGAFISTIVYPTNVVKSHQQTQVGGAFQSVYGTFRDVYEARGHKLRKLFTGVHVNYTRSLISWGIINASYEMLMKSFYNHKV